MTRLFVSSIANLIYALGIAETFDEIVFASKRNVITNEKYLYLHKDHHLASLIASIEGIKFTKTIFNDEKEIHFTQEDFVDIRLLAKKKWFWKRQEANLLGLNPEYLATFFPNIRSSNLPQLKLRAEMIIRILVPRGVRTFYALSTQNHRFLGFRSKPIDLETTQIKLSKWARYLNLFTNEELEAMLNKRFLLFLPLGTGYGGSADFNKRAIEDFISRALDSKIETIVIKNHPRDDSIWQFNLGERTKNVKILYFTGEKRFIPAEMILGLSREVIIGGMFSTCMKGMLPCFVQQPIIYMPNDPEISNWYNYAMSGLLQSFKNSVIYI